MALVIAFWKAGSAEHTSVQVNTYNRLDDSATRWQAESSTIFVDSASVVSTLIHSRTARDTVLVIPPVAAYLQIIDNRSIKSEVVLYENLCCVFLV